MLTEDVAAQVIAFQKNELTESLIYERLAVAVKEPENRKILERIAADERRHAEVWKKYSGREIAPDTFKVWKYYVIARLCGLTFGIKLMERAEEEAQGSYEAVSGVIPEARAIAEEEDKHEQALIAMINEDRLKYVGSIVLGLSDALVELTGALAGLTLALPQGKLVAGAGFLTGIAAGLSMAASEYFSTRSENGGKDPLKAALYTGIAYVVTVFFLIFPYLFFHNIYLSLAATMFNAVIVIFLFTFYVSVAQDLPFRKRFVEMVAISFGVAAVSFGIGFLMRPFLGGTSL